MENISILTSAIFALSFLGAFISIMLVPKKERKINLLSTMIMTAIFMMCYHTIVVALFKLLGISFYVILIAIADLLLAVAMSVCIYRKGKIQTYKINVWDIIALIVIALTGGYFAIKEFTTDLNIAYIMSDPAVHYEFAMRCIRDGTTTEMFFAETQNALFISIFAPYLDDVVGTYKLFILSDILMFMLSGTIFYISVRNFCKKNFQHIVVLFGIIVYMAGYPLNNMLYGFNYLGIGVSLIGYLLILFREYEAKEMNKHVIQILLSITFLCLSVCYMLFAPFVWIFGASTIIYLAYQEQKSFSVKPLLEIFYIFIIPFILTIRFCYFGFFVGNGLEISSTVAHTGGIYINNISVFIIWIPFAIYSIYHNIKRKEYMALSIFGIIWTITILGAQILRVNGIISDYYCYKLYYVFWLITLVLATQGFCNLVWKTKVIAPIVLCIVIGVTAIKFGNIETYAVSNLYVDDIFRFNKQYLDSERRFDEYSIDIYRWIYNNLYQESREKPIPFLLSIQNNGRLLWYQSITENYIYDDYLTWEVSLEEMIERMQNGEIDYVGTFYYDDIYQEYKEYLEEQEKLFETPSGAVYKIITR